MGHVKPRMSVDAKDKKALYDNFTQNVTSNINFNPYKGGVPKNYGTAQCRKELAEICKLQVGLDHDNDLIHTFGESLNDPNAPVNPDACYY